MKLYFSQFILMLSLLCAGESLSLGAGKSLIELKLGKSGNAYQGRVEFQTSSHCWLMGQDGRIHQVPLKKVSKFRKVSPSFKKYNLVQMRAKLRKEFGNRFEIQGANQYLVCAPRGAAKTYLKWFEQVHRDFTHYFRLRGLNLSKPDFTMVAIVFPNQKEFAEYSQTLGVRVSNTLRGYYHPVTNRVILYDSSKQVVRQNQPLQSPIHNLTLQSDSPGAVIWENTGRALGGKMELHDTIIHEGTHQVAFNMHLHSRIGNDPRWVVEGLATVFEAEGIRENSRNRKDRLNRERFLWFKDYRKNRRPKNALVTFVQSDRLFQTASLDAYSEAWALSFYLLETRPRKYVKFLKLVSSHSNGKNYTAEQRLKDFRQSFHENLEWLEVDYLRFHEKLAR